MDQATPPQISSKTLTLSGSHRVPLAITFSTSVAIVSGASLIYPALPVMASDLGVDEARIGLVMVAYTMPAIVLAPLFGIFADLRGRRWMLILGLALFGLAGSATALAPSFAWVLAFRALQGVGMSAITPLSIVLISDLLPDHHELAGQGRKVVIDRIAMIALPLIGGLLAALSWRVALLPYLLVLLIAVAAHLWMPETAKPGAETLRPYLARTWQALREPSLTTAFATGFLRFFLDYGLYIYLPLLLVLHYGASAVTTGWLIAVSAAGSIVTAVSIGRLHARQPAERLLAIAFLASAIALALIGSGAPLWIIALAAFIFGLGNGIISPLQKSLLTRRTPQNLRGGVVSVDRVIQQIAKSLAPTLMGSLLLVANLEAVFWSLCGLSLAGMLALIWIGRN